MKMMNSDSDWKAAVPIEIWRWKPATTVSSQKRKKTSTNMELLLDKKKKKLKQFH